MPKNYQKMLDETLSGLPIAPNNPRKLLLHSCCGPCSSAVLECLSAYFDITILYYNPNIYPTAEFNKRAEVQQQLVSSMNSANPVKLVTCAYHPEDFDKAVRGYESEPEGGERCRKCFALRLKETAKYAQTEGFDYFTTTLSVSPHKETTALNDIGGTLAEKYGVKYLYSDFKKKNGYKRSIELSKQYGLYRQQYCGCKYSMNTENTI